MKPSVMTANKQASPLPQSKRYEFQERIGMGGMGTVYRALDRETGQPVAIKVLKVKYTENPTLHRRLAREFRAASELEHPNIVHALALQSDGETSFVVFELVEGCSLGARIEKEGGLPEAEAIRIMTQITQALDYAHRRKVVHRDVKPDNILLLPDGRAKLTDFGLAKDYGENRDDDLTRNASAMGTPNYMAPEQFVNAKTAGVLCDVYSLGATLYNALTGTVPFTAKTPMVILNKKMKGDYKSVRSLVPGISERVDAAIAASLSPDPTRRPPTCLAFFKILTARDRAEAGPLRTVSQPLAAAMPEKNSNRRACIRFPLHVGSCGVVDIGVHGEDGFEESWPLVVKDVSAEGIGILLARRFETGTVLSIELGFGSKLPPRQLQLRVVRVKADKAGHWMHGCKFTCPLTPDDVKNLLKYA